MGIKIINILKDDSFPDILELFRRTDADEVIFVLPKNGRVFRTEDHFAAFASEAAGASKSVSMLCNNTQTTTWAHKYGFNVMSSGKSPAPAKKAKASLASQPPPMDQDIQDTNEDAFQSDVPMTSDETMGNEGQDERADEADPLHGMHIEEDADQKKTIEGETAELVGVNTDYIEAMWRAKAGVAAEPPTALIPQVRRSSPRKPHHFSKSLATGILAASVLVLGAIVYVTAGSATIAITPVAKVLDAQIAVQVSDVFSTVDANFGKLPGQLFEVSKTVTQDAQATGQRDVASKSRGKITVYNEFSSSPQTLIATTRFESSGGLIFRTLQTITVPGSTVQNGKPVAGMVTVDIVADKPGQEYDIPAGKFTVPAFKERGDTDRYAKFYGQSTTVFSGGANGPSKVVTQADYDTAKDAAIQAVKDQIKTAFAQQASGMIILDDIQPEITKVDSSVQPDDAASTFTITATGTIRTVAFRKQDLDDLLKQAILKKERLTIVPDKLQVSYGDIAFKPDLGMLVFTVALKGTGYAPVSEQDITNDIKGMAMARIHDYFVHREGVASATVSLSPFWVRSVPTNDGHIHLQVRYNDQ